METKRPMLRCHHDLSGDQGLKKTTTKFSRKGRGTLHTLKKKNQNGISESLEIKNSFQIVAILFSTLISMPAKLSLTYKDKGGMVKRLFRLSYFQIFPSLYLFPLFQQNPRMD